MHVVATIVVWGDVSIVVYLNNIVVCGSDPVQVWYGMKLVLEHLAAAGFTLNTTKSHFLVSKMKVLGY